MLESCFHNQISLVCHAHWVAYHHGCLIANRLFYGSPSELLLESLGMVAVGAVINSSRTRRKWATETTGATIQDEPVLYVKHTTGGTGLDTSWAHVTAWGY